MSTIVKAVCQHCQRVTTVPAEAIAAATTDRVAVTYDHIERLQHVVEGECDGLMIDGGQALAILSYVFHETPPNPPSDHLVGREWGDDWTVDDTDTAREILLYLGIGDDASREPGADRRRDKVAQIIRARIDAAALSSAPHMVGPWKVYTTDQGTYIGVGDVEGQGILDCGFGVWGSEAEKKASADLIVTAVNAYLAKGSEDLAERMKAAGMFTIEQMMGVTPLTRWKIQAGMTDLNAFGDWLDRKVAEFLTMKAAYDLGDKDDSDELYEWVLAHAGAFSSIRENFRAALSAEVEG